MTRADILVDEDNDLRIVSGDFTVGESQVQHIAHIVEANQGAYKQNPLVGVGIRRMLNGTITGIERRTVKLQLLADGIEAKSVEFADGKLSIEL